MAVGQNPVLLLGVEEQAQDVEAQSVFLVRGSFIRADQKAALYLRISQQHDLKAEICEIMDNTIPH